MRCRFLFLIAACLVLCGSGWHFFDLSWFFRFTTPENGAVVRTDRTVAVGRIYRPLVESIEVNGLTAEVSGGTFLANEIPLAAGKNTLEATSTFRKPKKKKYSSSSKWLFGDKSSGNDHWPETLTIFRDVISEPVGASCNEAVVFGPRGHLRRAEKPWWDTERFSITDPQGEYFLRVRVGDDKRTSHVSGTVELNGEVVLDSKDFHRFDENRLPKHEHDHCFKWFWPHRPFTIEKPVHLATENELRIRLRGWPGAFIIVEIEHVSGDTTAPELSIETPPEGSFQSVPAVTVVGQAGDSNLSSVKVGDVEATLLDGGRFQASDVPLVEGANAIALEALDLCGNRSSLTLHLIRDTIAPAISLEAPVEGSYVKDPPVITFSATDANLQSVAATLNGSPIESGFTVIEEGAHTIVVTALDKAGNASEARRSFTADRTPPTLTFYPEDATYHNLEVVPNVTASDDNLDTLEVLLNGAIFIGDPVRAEGVYVLAATARDLATNETNGSINFTIDMTPPEIMVSGVTENLVTNQNITPVVTVNDTFLASETVTLNSQPFISGTPITDENSYDLFVEASDYAGNTSTRTVPFTIDRTPPLITVSGVSDGLVTRDPVTPAATVTDPHLETVEMLLDGQPFTDGTVVDTEGNHTFEVRASDMAGNASAVRVDFAIDRTAPHIEVFNQADPTTPIPEYSCGEITPVVIVTDNHLKEQTILLNDEAFTSGTTITQEDDYRLVVEAEDEAGHSKSLELRFAIDCTVPRVIIQAPEDESLTNQTLISVSGTVEDDSPVKEVRVGSVDAVLDGNHFSASGVELLVEDWNTITAIAEDEAGNAGSAEIDVRLDLTPPTIALSGPTTGRRNQSITVAASASDDVELASVQFSLEGAPGDVLPGPSFEHTFTIPAGAPGGSAYTVTAVATDRAGNTTPASPHSVRVVSGGGFLVGEVYDDSRGLPLPGVTVFHNSKSMVSDLQGRFGMFTEETTALVHIERDGFTAVERRATVSSEQGTLFLDARLTPLDPQSTPIGSGVGTAASSKGHFELVVSPGGLSSDTEIRLTEVSPQGLRAPLPLGWSPVGSVQIDPEELSLNAELHLKRSVTGLSLSLVQFRTDLGSWVVESAGLTGEDWVTALVSSGGAWAFVVPDTGATAPPPAEPGEPLPESIPVEVAFGQSADSEVDPEASPITPEAKATGSVVLYSLVPQPSGTILSATVEETFDSFHEGELKPEPFTQEIVLYRFPARPDGELHASFPVTPSRAFTAEELRQGRVHVEIRPSPAFLVGALVTSQGLMVTGEGGAELVVPAGAVAEAVAAFTRAVDPVEVELASAGLDLVAAAEVDLAGQSLALSGTLSVPAPDGLTEENLFAARVLFVSGQRKLKLLGPAVLDVDRLSTSGVTSGGTYLFFQSSEPLALVQGVVTENTSAARLAVVESSTTPFSDVTPDNGAYLVAAALQETHITARSLLSGNTGAATVAPTTPDPITTDIVLAATGPFVTGVFPPDTARGVAVAPAITIQFSEPVEPSTVTATSFSVRVSGGDPVEGRITLGPSNRSASFLPTANLEPQTSYEIAVSDTITDTTGNGLLPFASTFTTREVTVASFDPDAVTVSFPDGTGEVTVQAPPGSFEDGASVLIINKTNGIVVSGSVNPDGGFSFKVRAAITDEIQIRILDSSERETVIDKTEFKASDGRVAIGKKGGKIQEGEFLLDVPAGALDTAAIFKMTPVPQEEIDLLPLPEAALGKGAAVEIDTGGVALKKEAKLSFPIPAEAAADAAYIVVRKVVQDPLTLYETIDSASVKDGKVTTNSFPFLGVQMPGFFMTIWYPTLPDSGKSVLGVITGTAQETDAHPLGPTTIPLAGAEVRVDEDTAQGDFISVTGEDGRFVLWDLNFGGTVHLLATEGGREVRAAAFEDLGLLARFPTLGGYGKVGGVVFNFPLSPPPPPPSSIDVRLFRTEEEQEVEITNGFAVVGEELVIRVFFTTPPGRAGLEINDVPVTLENVDGFSYRAQFTPMGAKGYTITVSSLDAFLRQTSSSKSFLAVAAGSGNDAPLEGPPSVITDAAVPRPGDEGVPLSQIFNVLFTEPVTHVSTASVILRKAGGGVSIPVELIGSRTGWVGPVEPDSILTALTVRPLRGLEYSASYELVFTGEILDTDEPTASALSPDPTVIDFNTFTPASLGAAGAPDAWRMAVVGDRAYVTRNTYPASVRTFDISDPTQPTDLGDTFVSGVFPYIAAEEGVNLGTGETDLVAVLTTNTFSAQGILYILDVRGHDPPLPQAAVVTTNQGGDGGYAAAVELFKGFAYVSTGTVGLKVIDLNRAAELFRSVSSFELSRALHTRGEGFGQQAILNVIPIEVGQENLITGPLAVDNTSLGRVAFVSSPGHLSSIDVSGLVQEPVLATVPLQIESLEVGWVNGIELTTVDGRELAVLAGDPAGEALYGTLGVVDVTDPANPLVLSVTELQGSSGQSLALDEDGTTVFIGTPDGVEAYNLTDPASPQFAGRFEGLSGDIAIANGLLVTAGETAGLQTTALSRTAVINNITPSTVVYTQANAVTARDITIDFAVVPSDADFESTEVRIFQNDEHIESLTTVHSSPQGRAVWPTGSVVDPLATYYALVVIDPGQEGESQGFRKDIPLGRINLEIRNSARSNIILPEEIFPSPNEEYPGAFVMVNVDDDNGNTKKDKGEGDNIEVNGEDDLVPLELVVDSRKLKLEQVLLEVPEGRERIKVWLKPTRGELVGLPKLWNLTAGDRIPTTVYVEGFNQSQQVADSGLRLKAWASYNPNEPFEDTVRLTVIEVDLDIDSDNDANLERDENEDKIEDLKSGLTYTGKLLAANLNDDDMDDIPDFADGFNLDGSTPNPSIEDDVNGDEIFAQLDLSLSNVVDLAKAKIRFNYLDSDPATTTRSGSDPDYTYRAAPDHLRIWTESGSVARNPMSVGSFAPGNYVPSGVAFSPSQLGFGPDHVAHLYVEGVAASGELADQRILVEVDPDGPGPVDYFISDAVRLTVVSLEITGVTLPNDDVSFTTRDEPGHIENEIGLTAEITPNVLSAYNPSIQWIVDDDPRVNGVSPAPPIGSNLLFGEAVDLEIAIPVVLLGRGYPLNYRISASVNISGLICGSLWQRVKQDERDQSRQEYLDMQKDSVPERSEFVNAASYNNPGGNFPFDEINDGDYSWAIFTIAGHLENIRTALSHALPVNSGYRNPINNLNVGGADNSRHIYGDGVDIDLVDLNGDGLVDMADAVILENAAIAEGAFYTDIYYTPTDTHVHADWR